MNRSQMEDLEMTDDDTKRELPDPPGEQGHIQQRGAPGGARQHVRSGTSQGAVARPGGATQNSGGALTSNDEEEGGKPEPAAG
ncbi:MAG: hypothetical protein ABIY52_08620 [Gemmatimonadaceae bacterium]